MKSSALIFAAMLFLTFSSYGQSQAMFMQDVSWSPDGNYLAFTGMHDIDQKANLFKADIYVIKTDGTNLAKITGDEKNDFYTAWVKQRVVFSSETPGTKLSDIYIANADGSNLKQLTTGPGRNTTPTVSRDGKRIAFVSTREGDKYQIYAMNSDGSNVTRLTKDSTVGYFNPQFSPDGKRIVYYAEKGDGKDQVWIMNADGSNPTLLTANIGHNIFPGWSPDGKRIIFRAQNAIRIPPVRMSTAVFSIR
jgi:Tol biopolymer transport system component